MLPDIFKTFPLAHRGLHDLSQGRVENSFAAVEAAVKLGYGLEIDVQLSSDGVAMVFHDDTLDRLTSEKGLFCTHNSQRLKQIALCGGGHIPTLSDILKLVAGRVPLLVELKDQTGNLSQSDGRLESAVAGVLNSYSGVVAVMSFNPSMMAHLKQLAPELPRGLTTASFAADEWPMLSSQSCRMLSNIPDYDRLEACFISHQISDLRHPRVADLKALGAVILSWTACSLQEEYVAREVADNIIFETYLPA